MGFFSPGDIVGRVRAKETPIYSRDLFLKGRATLLTGDSLSILDDLEENSIDSCCTDPPYHLIDSAGDKGIYNKEWDGGDIAFDPVFWAKVFRVLKPGGHVTAFGAPRRAHRMVCAIEDAGFEIRDTFFWLFAEGQPKSGNVSRGIDKELGAERKKGRRYHTIRNGAVSGGGRNIDKFISPWVLEAKRRGYIEVDLNEPITDQAKEWFGWGTKVKPCVEPITLARKPLSEKNVAKNVLKWRTGALNINGARLNTSADTVKLVQKYFMPGRKFNEAQSDLGRWPTGMITDGSQEVIAALGAEGFLSRIFYTAKPKGEDKGGSQHPTIKPLDLMRWLIAITTPPKGIVLDPFAGSGTTGIAAIRNGYKTILCESDLDYAKDIRRRLGELEHKFI